MESRPDSRLRSSIVTQPPNPYAPPSLDADTFDPSGMPLEVNEGLRRQGDLLVFPVKGSVFPPRCVVCNEAADKRLRRTLFWHPSGYYALIAAGWLIYVVVSLIVRKRAQCEVYLCAKHVARRRNLLLAAGLSVLVFIAGVWAMSNEPAGIILLGLLAFVVLITCVILARVITPKRIDKQYAWVKIGRPFLESIDP